MKVTRRDLLVGAGAAAVGLAAPAVHAQGQGRTLLVAAPNTPEGFDGDALKPGSQEVVVQAYEGLTRYERVTRDGREYLNPDKIVGHLAESWTTSPDGRSWVFKLRQGVKSAFGNELTAADVEWGWSKSIAQKRTGNFIATVCNVTAVKAVGKYEVEFTLSAPTLLLLSCLTMYVPGIYDSTEVKKHATPEDPWALKWLDSNTAGFGAYHLEMLKGGEQAVFVANRNYFLDQPYFSRVVYRAIPSAASRVTLLKAGQVNWIHRSLPQQAADLIKDKRVKTQEGYGRAIASVRMNNKFKPFDNKLVRQAFNYALDKELIRKAVFYDIALDAKSIVPPIVGGYDPSFFKYDHDPAKAKALLTEAGFDFDQEIELLYSGIFNWEEPMSIQVCDQLRKIDVKAKPVRITDSDMRARGAPARQDLPFFSFEDGPVVLDPVYTLFLLGHSKGVSNRTNYANPQMDVIIDEARTTLDTSRRLDLVKQAQALWIEDVPWIMTVYPTTVEAMTPNISGWVPHPDEHERWRDLRAG